MSNTDERVDQLLIRIKADRQSANDTLAAIDAVKQAQEDLQKASASGSGSQVIAATRAHADAQFQLATAIDEVAQATQKATAMTEEEADAFQRVFDASLKATDAQNELQQRSASGGGISSALRTGGQLANAVGLGGVGQGLQIGGEIARLQDELPKIGQAFSDLTSGLSATEAVIGGVGAVGVIAAVSALNAVLEDERQKTQQLADAGKAAASSFAKQIFDHLNQEQQTNQVVQSETFAQNQQALDQLRKDADLVRSAYVSLEDQTIATRNRLAEAQQTVKDYSVSNPNITLDQFQQAQRDVIRYTAELTQNESDLADARDADSKAQQQIRAREAAAGQLFLKNITDLPGALEKATFGWLQGQEAAFLAAQSEVQLADSRKYLASVSQAATAAEQANAQARSQLQQATDAATAALAKDFTQLQNALGAAKTAEDQAINAANSQAVTDRLKAFNDEQDALADAALKAGEQRADTERNYRETIAKIDRQFNAAATTALANRDAVAYLVAKKNRDDQTKDAKQAEKDKLEDIDRSLRDENTRIKKAYDKQLLQIQAALDKQIAAAKLKYDEAVTQAKAAYQSQLEALANALGQQQSIADAAHANMLAKEALFWEAAQNLVPSPAVTNVNSGVSTALANLPSFAPGGIPPLNQLVRINDPGPESALLGGRTLAVFGTNARIYNAATTRAMMSGESGGIHITLNGLGMSKNEIVRHVSRELERSLEHYVEGQDDTY